MPDIVITPNRGTSNNPKIDFTGTSAGTIKLEVLSDGSIAWNGANGSLFSIADSLSGSLMSVNDISGLPAFEVFSDNRVVVGQFGAKLGIGITNPSYKLDVSGTARISGATIISGATTFNGGNGSQVNGNGSTLSLTVNGNWNSGVGSLIQLTTSDLNFWSNGGIYYFKNSAGGNAATINSTNGNIETTGGIATNIYGDSSNLSNGISLWGTSNATTSLSVFKRWSNIFGRTNTLLTEATGYATYHLMDSAGRGWVWRYISSNNTSTGTNVASLRNDTGQMSLGTAWDWSGGYHAQLNIAAGQGSATTYRDIDLHGGWSPGEGHAITATYASGANNIVGQIVFQYDAPNSRIRFGKLHYSADSSSYPLELISTSTTAANLILNNGNVGLGVTSPSHKLHFEAGSFIGLPPSFSYVPSSWTRGSSGIIMAGSNNADGSGWSYGGRIVEVDEGDGLNIAFDVNYTNSWTNNAMVISGRAGKLGNVGIGTISPSYRLHVEGDSYSSTGFYVRNSAATFIGSVNNMSGISVNGTSYDTFIVSGGNQTITVKSGGNVGIGTTTPAHKFHLNNNGSTSSGFYADIGNINTTSTLFEHSGSNPPVPFRLKKSGYSGAAGTYGILYLHMNDNTNGNGSSLYFTLNDSAGNEREYAGIGAVIRSNTAGGQTGDLILMTSDGGTQRAEKMRIISNGNVGIGNTSPSYKLHVSGDIYANGGWFRVSSSSGIYWETYGGGWYMNDSTWLRAYNDKAIITNNEIRGTIFVDANDTGYYVNPATGTNLNGTLVNNGGTAMTAGWNRNLLLSSTFPVIVFNSNSTKYSGIGVDYSNAAAGMYFWVNGSSADISGTATVALGLNTGNYVTAYGSFRAPIFYDSDNTAYYADPASTSDSALRIRGGTLYGPNTTWGAYLMVGGDGRQNYTDNTSTASVTTTNGNLHLDAASGSNSYINWYDGNDFLVGTGDSGTARLRVYGPSNYTEVTGSMRAPIFYDRDDTNFYVDGNAGTALKYLRVNGDWGGSPFGSGAETLTVTGTYASICQRQTNGAQAYVLHHVSDSYYLYIGRGSTNGSDWNWALRAMPNQDGSYVIFNTSARAPIFYDSNDTNYYVDPASTSITNILRANSILSPNGQTVVAADSAMPNSGGSFIHTLALGPSGNDGHILGMSWSNTTSIYGAQIWLDTDPNNLMAIRSRSSGGVWNNWTYAITDWSNDQTKSGYFQSNSSLRAPIFYDSNDNSYYVDPNSTSVLNGLTVGGYGVVRTAQTINSNIDSDYGETYVTFDPVPSGSPPISSPNIHTINVGNNFVRRTQIAFTYDHDRAWFRRRNDSGWQSWYEFAVFGNTASNGSLYGTIYYDGNDTNYHIDPASTSRVNTISFVSGASFGPYFQYNNQSNLRLQAGAQSAAVGISGYDYNGNWRFQLYGDTNGYGFLNGNWAGWDIKKIASGNLYLNGESTYYIGTNEIYYNRVYGVTDIRSPIFYDYNDTAYYCNPAGTSQFVRLDVVDVIGVNDDIRYGIRMYDSTAMAAGVGGQLVLGYKYQGSNYTEGAILKTYKLDGTDGNYGSGLKIQVRNHGESLATKVQIDGSGNMVIGGNMTNNAYDSVGSTRLLFGGGNDPNSYFIGTNLNNYNGNYTKLDLRWHTGIRMGARPNYGGIRIFSDETVGTRIASFGEGDAHVRIDNTLYVSSIYDINNTGYYVDPNNNANIAGQIYVGGWFRNYGNQGLYNETHGNHWYATGNDYWNLAGNNASNIGIILRSGGHQGTIRGYVYADSNNHIGFLNNGGAWRLRVVDGDYTLADGSSIRGQLFYDSNDTGYYVNPNSASNLYRLNVAGYPMRSSTTIDMSNTSLYSTSNYYPVVINLPTGMPTRLRIVNALNSNVPSWATHGSGFTCHVEWTSNGSGWGTIAVNRTIHRYTEAYANSTICGGITQMTNSNNEVIWLRGGGQYYFESDSSVTPTAYYGTYTDAGQSVTPQSSTINNVWQAASTHMSVGAIKAAQFIDVNDEGYYLDPNGTSKLNNLQVVGTITDPSTNGRITLGGNFHIDAYNGYDIYANYYSGRRFRTFYGSQSESFRCDTDGIVYAYSQFRAPIIYDSNDAGYYVDPNSYSNLYRLSTYFAAKDQNTNWTTAFQNTPTSGMAWHGDVSSGGPTGTWWFYQSMRHSNSSNYWGTQIAYGWEDNANEIYQRNITSNSFGGWVRYINTNNWTSIIPTASPTVTGVWLFRSNKGSGVYSGNTNTPPLQVYSDDSGAAFMSFHRSGSYAVNMGLDPDNIFRIGGWSASSNRLQLDMAGNLWSASSMRSPIFYDENNTGYYFDGAGTSVANNVQITTLGVGTAASGTTGEIRATNNITAYYSDERLKTRLGKIEDPIEKVKSLSGFYFEANETAVALGYDKKREVGVSAQEVQAVLPEIIAPAPISDKYMTVRYEKLIPLLIEAIKEQQTQIEQLSNELKSLKNKL